MQVTAANGNSREAVTHARALAATLARIAVEVNLLALEAQGADAVADDLTFDVAQHDLHVGVAGLDAVLGEKRAEREREASTEVIQIRHWSELRAA
jgi:hypothetical protein